MQNVSLQTVLQLSNAAERVQQTALQGGVLTPEQLKELEDKYADVKQHEVQSVEPKEEIKIRDEEREEHRAGQQAKEKEKKEAGPAETPEPAKEEEQLPLGAADQGRILNIKV